MTALEAETPALAVQQRHQQQQQQQHQQPQPQQPQHLHENRSRRANPPATAQDVITATATKRKGTPALEVEQIASKLSRTLRQRQMVSDTDLHQPQLTAIQQSAQNNMGSAVVVDRTASVNVLNPRATRRKGRPRKISTDASPTRSPSLPKDENNAQSSSPSLQSEQTMMSTMPFAGAENPPLLGWAVAPSAPGDGLAAKSKFEPVKVRLRRMRVEHEEAAFRKAVLKFADGRLARRARKSHMAPPFETSVTRPSSGHMAREGVTSAEAPFAGRVPASTAEEAGSTSASASVAVLPATAGVRPTKRSVASPTMISSTSDSIGDLHDVRLGDVLWCKLGNYPFWPAVVIRDSATGQFVQKVARTSAPAYSRYFVQYLGEERPVFGWTGAPIRVLPFKGLAEFQRYAKAKIESASVRSRAREREFYSLKFASEGRRASWNRAVAAAESRRQSASNGNAPLTGPDVSGVQGLLTQLGQLEKAVKDSMKSNAVSDRGQKLSSLQREAKQPAEWDELTMREPLPPDEISSRPSSPGSVVSSVASSAASRRSGRLQSSSSRGSSAGVGSPSVLCRKSNPARVRDESLQRETDSRRSSVSDSQAVAVAASAVTGGRQKDDSAKKVDPLPSSKKRQLAVEHGQLLKAVCSTCLKGEQDDAGPGRKLVQCACGNSFHPDCNRPSDDGSSEGDVVQQADGTDGTSSPSEAKKDAVSRGVGRPVNSVTAATPAIAGDDGSANHEVVVKNNNNNRANGSNGNDGKAGNAGHDHIVDSSHAALNKCAQCISALCSICGVEREGEEAIAARCCPRRYHLHCIRQASLYVKLSADKKIITGCPRDACVTCHALHPSLSLKKSGFVRCAQCPATYHRQRSCVPAACTFLTADLVLCPRHLSPTSRKVNMDWCLVCGKAGALVCCDVCPVCVHPACVNLSGQIGDQRRYECPECSDWLFPVFGRIVWAKLGNYSWWPSYVVHPTELPDSVQKARKPHDHMAVFFFGTHNYSWLQLTQVYPFQPDDARQSRSGTWSSKKDSWKHNYAKALNEAVEAFEAWESQQSKKTACANPPRYRHILVNTVKSESCRLPRSLDEQVLCSCTPKQPCVDNSCLNRVLNIECGPDCALAERCRNQRFQRREYKKTATFFTADGRGWGLRAEEEIARGEFVIEYVGEIIDRDEMRRRIERLAAESDRNVYFLTADGRRIIDAGPAGNVSRFINHSCDPNLFARKWLVRGRLCVGLFAARDIKPGEELVFDYQMEFEHAVQQECLCGAANCAGFLGVPTLPLRSPSPAGSASSRGSLPSSASSSDSTSNGIHGAKRRMALKDKHRLPKGSLRKPKLASNMRKRALTSNLQLAALKAAQLVRQSLENKRKRKTESLAGRPKKIVRQTKPTVS